MRARRVVLAVGILLAMLGVTGLAHAAGSPGEGEGYRPPRPAFMYCQPPGAGQFDGVEVDPQPTEMGAYRVTVRFTMPPCEIEPHCGEFCTDQGAFGYAFYRADGTVGYQMKRYGDIAALDYHFHRTALVAPGGLRSAACLVTGENIRVDCIEATWPVAGGPPVYVAVATDDPLVAKALPPRSLAPTPFEGHGPGCAACWD